MFDLLGRLDTRLRACVVPMGGDERRKTSYDAAVGDRHGWVAMRENQAIPIRAVLVGMTQGRDPTYACRVNHIGNILPGKVVRTVCFIPASGREYRYAAYSILVDV